MSYAACLLFVNLCKQRQEYVKYAKIIPLARLLNVKIPSKWYRRVVGGLEILCGIALTFIPHSKMPTYLLTITISLSMIILMIFLFSFRTYKASGQCNSFDADGWSYTFALDGGRQVGEKRARTSLLLYADLPASSRVAVAASG